MTVHWGIPVTTPLRTLLDLSRHLSHRWQTVRVTHAQLEQRATTAERFEALLTPTQRR